MRWCVFCGSSPGDDPAWSAVATGVGRLLAEHAVELVYGGGNTGLMGAVADATLAAGGRAIGVIPHALAAREVAHAGLTQLHIVESMHERKARMNELSDGFLMLPGGFGTFEEFCEVVTWVQLGIIAKPCVIFNAGGFYDPLIAMFDRATEHGFITAHNRTIVRVVVSLDALAAVLEEPVASSRR
jgi:uncharacterized protein (TIGR00730 family)